MKNYITIKKNNKTMKNVFNINLILAMMLILFNSCSEEFLDNAPLDELTVEGAFNTKADAELALNGAYGTMVTNDPHTYRWFYTIVGDMRADNSHGGPPGTITNCELLESLAGDLEPGIWNWYEAYKYSAAANIILDNVPKIEDPNFSDSERKNILGQAYFLRAFHYYHLARQYRDVPLILSQDGDLLPAKSPEAEVYAQIVKDLELAESYLPTEHANRFLTSSRGTKGSAQSLLAKVYVETGDYAKAAEYAGKVMDSGVYSLVETYDHLWDGNHQNTTEAIFELQHVASTMTGTYHPAQMLPPGDLTIHEADKPGEGVGWAFPRFNVLNHELIEAFDEMGDSIRKWSSTLTVTDRSLMSDPPLGFADPTEPVSHTYKNGRHWDGFSGRWNVLLMRYSDIILLRAEALNQIGQTAQAITYLNQVRARVKLAPTTASSQSEVALAILKERRLELAMEGQRFWDLKRYYGEEGLVNYLKGLTDTGGNNLGKNPANVHQLYLPIPQRDLDINPNLVQNPGY